MKGHKESDVRKGQIQTLALMAALEAKLETDIKRGSLRTNPTRQERYSNKPVTLVEDDSQEAQEERSSRRLRGVAADVYISLTERLRVIHNMARLASLIPTNNNHIN